MSAIYKRELDAFFRSIPCYIFISGLLLMGGVAFSTYNIIPEKTDFVPVLNAMLYATLLLTPLLTMKLVAGERENRTDRLMLTSPVSSRVVVLAKFFSAYTVFVIALAFTLVLTLLLSILGAPSWQEIAVGYLGLALFGAALIAVGIFISSMMRRTRAAAFATLAVMLVILLMDLILPYIGGAEFRTIVARLMPLSSAAFFMAGFLSPSAVLYFISLCFLSLLLTVRMMEHRKWARGRC